MSAAGRRIVFVGAVHEAEPALEALLRANADVVAIVMPSETMAKTLSGAVDLEHLARRFGVPVIRTGNLNSPQDVEGLRKLAPDLIVVVGWTRLLSAEVLAIPPRGCVGFHASLLPNGRGRAPVNWAILRGETVTGNTFMYLAAEADAGDIIDQRAIAIEPEDTCATVYARVAQAGAEMLAQHLDGLLSGTAPRRPQGKGSDPLLPKRTPDMGITDWNRPARAVHDWIRALTHPYPGAFTLWHGNKLFLWYSDPPDGRPADADAGVIVGAEDEAMLVATREGCLRVTRVQDADGEEESGASWWRRRNRQCRRFDRVDEAESRRVLGLDVARRST